MDINFKVVSKTEESVWIQIESDQIDPNRVVDPKQTYSAHIQDGKLMIQCKGRIGFPRSDRFNKEVGDIITAKIEDIPV